MKTQEEYRNVGSWLVTSELTFILSQSSIKLCWIGKYQENKSIYKKTFENNTLATSSWSYPKRESWTSHRTHWDALSPEGSMHFRFSSSGERIDCWTEVRGTQGASLEDANAQVACELGTEWLKFGPSLGCRSAEEWDDHQRCDSCCPRRDGPGRIFETGNDLLILLCSNACINRNKVLFITSNGIWVPQKRVFFWKKGGEIKCGGITALKSLL